MNTPTPRALAEKAYAAGVYASDQVETEVSEGRHPFIDHYVGYSGHTFRCCPPGKGHGCVLAAAEHIINLCPNQPLSNLRVMAEGSAGAHFVKERPR